jgi:hypothetical protein
MTTSLLLFMGMGPGELLILIIFFGIPLLMKIKFIHTLNEFMDKAKNTELSSNSSGNWLLLIPFIGFFYAISLSKKVDLLISEKLGSEYKVYRTIINNLLWLITLRIITVFFTIDQVGNNPIITISNFATLILCGIRISNGIKLYRKLNELNSIIE